MRPAIIEPALMEHTEVVPAPNRGLERRSERRPQRRRADPRLHDEGRVDVGLWIPTTAIFVLLAPFALLLTPLLYFAPRDMRPDPFRTVLTLGTLLLALTGTVVEVDTPDARVRLRFF
jgi:hypothetical protein